MSYARPLLFLLTIFFLTPLLAESALLTPENVVIEINRVREEHGLPNLTENKKLNEAALIKAQEIASLGFLTHTTSSAGVPWAPLNNVGYAYEKVGEILAVHISTAEGLVAAWMDSVSHRETILSSEYKDIGIGIYSGLWSGVESSFAAGYLARPEQAKVNVEMMQKLIILLNQLILNYQKILMSNVR